MRDLIELGVDGIMTDAPPLLSRVIDELGVGD
jgi:glycerophosphoryl diester phosphodiesterase